MIYTKLAGINWGLLIYSLIPIVVGAIAAIVLYTLFVSELVGGHLAPHFECRPGKTCKDIGEMLRNFGPVAPSDQAKALIWSFLAGFSERLVPGFLDTLKASDKDGGENDGDKPA